MIGFHRDNQDNELKDIITSLVQPWLKNCCIANSQPQKTALPTRLIDVHSAANSCHLSETTGQRGEYVILSYCWGKGNDRAKTTQNNLAARKHTIQISSLPATIRQAIQITKALGIRYLWVDAICIVQAHSSPPAYDELEDWRREAPKMGQYYQNAALTIAATASMDSEHGFILERKAQKYPVSPCPIGSWTDNTKTSSNAVIIPDTPPSNHQVNYGPLYTRGWTLQERVLSRHILHWTWESVFWECGGCIKASESHPSLSNPTHGSSDKVQRYVWSEALSELKNSYNHGYFAEVWLDLVEEYSQMSLSYESDRLIAIQGLVDQILLPNDTYIAGMFQSFMIKGLAWCNSAPTSEKVPSIPSWSWASLSAGNLYFWHLEGRLATLESANPFDIMKQNPQSDGQMNLKGPTMNIHTNLLQSEDNSRIATISTTYPFKSYFYFDTLSRAPAYTGNMTLLALGWDLFRESSKTPSGDESIKRGRLVIGLVLWPVTGKVGWYRRIGMFQVRETTKSTEWDDGTKESVYII